MATVEEIMLVLTAKDNASGTLKGINGFLTTNVGSAITRATSGMLGFAKDSIDAAMTAENEWNRFGAAINSTGGNWEANKDSIKSWVKTFSNSMGRSVGDTRSAMTAYMNYGMSIEESESAMKAATGLAAAMGTTQEEAANKIIKGFAGQGRGLKSLGINLDDYKDKTTGVVDRTKLLNAIMEKTGGAADKYANSTQAKAQRVQNQLAALKTDFGQQLLVALEPLLPILQQFLQAINNLPQPIKAVGVAFGALVAGAGLVSGPLLSMMGIFQQLTSVFGNFGGTGGAGGGGTGSVLGKVKTKIQTTVKDAEQIGTMAPEATAAAAGEEATAVSMSGIASGAMSLLAPLLEIAIVVAVMIPIIAALAAEALLFVKAIQVLIQALSFDSIDLSGAINGITQVSQAMVMVAAAMGAMTLAGLTTAIANVMSLGLLVPSIALALGEIKLVANELMKLNSIPSIGATGVIKLRMFTTSVKLVESAVKSMANLSWDVMSSNLMMLGGLLGSFSSNIGSAINDIKTAAQKISEINNLPTIDEGVKDKLTQTTESLAKVAEAIGSLRKVNDAQVTWNPLTNFGNALKSAKSDLQKAAQTLRAFNGADFSIPEGIGPKITTLADALKPIASAIGSLSGIDSSLQNWNPFTNFENSLKSAKSDLQKAAATLRGFNGINFEIPEGIGGKIKTLADALKPISTALGVLSGIGEVEYNANQNGGLTTALQNAKADLQNAAKALKELANLPDVPDGTATKIIRVADACKVVKRAIDSFNDNPVPALNNTGQATNINGARPIITNIALAIQGYQNLPTIPEGIATRVLRIADGVKPVKQAIESLNTTQVPPLNDNGTATNINNAKAKLIQIGTALSSLNTIPPVEGVSGKLSSITTAVNSFRSTVSSIGTTPMPVPNIGNIQTAVTRVKQIAQSINGLSGTSVGGATGALNSIKHAMNQIRSVLTTSVGSISASATNVGRAITNGIKSGMNNLGGTLRSVMTSAMGQVKSAAHSGAQQAGSQATSAFKSSFKLTQTVNEEMGHMVTAINNKKSEIVSAIQNLANDATTTFKLSLEVQSPGLMARTMRAEMGYIKDSVTSRAASVISAVRNMSQGIVNAFGNPSLTIADDFNNLSKLTPSSFNAMGTVTQQTIPSNSTNGDTIININDGAVKLDARNLSLQECKQIMIMALENMDQIRNVNIRGDYSYG